MKFLSFFIIIIAVLMITSCKKDNSTTDTASLYIPTAADATSGATLQELQLGRDLYIGNCGACHADAEAGTFEDSAMRLPR